MGLAQQRQVATHLSDFVATEAELIRDKLPQIFASDGDVYTLATASAAQMEKLLVWKLTEEFGELYSNPVAEEMADVREVLLAVQSHYRFEPVILEAVRTMAPPKPTAHASRSIFHATCSTSSTISDPSGKLNRPRISSGSAISFGASAQRA